LIELDSEGRSIDINSTGNLIAVGDDKTYAKLFDIRTMKLLCKLASLFAEGRF
jgi:hypothetical protein